MGKELKLKVYDKNNKEFLSSLEDSDEILIFDVLKNQFKIFNLRTMEFKNIPCEFEIVEYIGQKDYNEKEIYDGDKLDLGNGLKGTVRYIPELSSFQVFYDLGNKETEVYYDLIDVDDYKKIIE